MTTPTALVIDDNIKNVNVLARLLEEQGLASIQITNPSYVDAILEKAPTLTVVFVDLEMPALDGFQVLERVKASIPDVPVIAYTVHISEIHAAHQRGFDGFVGKPIDPDKFPHQLARILKGDAVWETI